MKTRRVMKGMMCLLVFAPIVAGVLSLEAQDNLLKPKSLEIWGHVVIRVFPNNSILIFELTASIYSNNSRKYISGLLVKVMGHRAKERFPGRYYCDINGFTPVVGAQVVVTVEQSPNPQAFKQDVFKGVQATGTISSLIEIAKPASDEHFIKSAVKPSLMVVSWSGGNPPYNMQVWNINPMTYGSWQHQGYSTRVLVPWTSLRPGKYEISVGSQMQNFTFSSVVAPNSIIDFRQTALRNIYIE
jgi:hypothetical protein